MIPLQNNPQTYLKTSAEIQRTLNFEELYNIKRYFPFVLHAKMGSIKDRNGVDLTEAEDIKKRWQEYT